MIIVPKNKFLGTDIYSPTIIFIEEHLPPLQSLSETLHVAIPICTSISAFNTTLSPAFERGFSTEILPSDLILV